MPLSEGKRGTTIAGLQKSELNILSILIFEDRIKI
jgi:hypothetical protein